MRLLVCGDRNWIGRALILEEIRRRSPSLVIHGCARGADTIAGEMAESLGIDVMRFPADWTKHGKAAGPIRMLKEGDPDEVIAFHTNIDSSKGTADMVRQARKSGVPVTVYGSQEKHEGFGLMG